MVATRSLQLTVKKTTRQQKTLEGQLLMVKDGERTAISSRVDGLSYAFGTSTGHTLLYDIRSPKPLATKDQGYGLPVKNVCWIEGGSRMAGDGLVLSADKKVIKIWDRNSVCFVFLMFPLGIFSADHCLPRLFDFGLLANHEFHVCHTCV